MCSMSVLCPLCAHTSFVSIDALRVRLIEAANDPLNCPICEQTLQGLDKLTIHLFSHAGVLRKVISQESTGNVQQVHCRDVKDNGITLAARSSTQPYSCNFCEMNFSSEQFLQMHMDLAHQNRGKRYFISQQQTAKDNACAFGSEGMTTKHDFKCHLCPKTFKMKGSLRIHLKVVHLIGIRTNADGITRLTICDLIQRKEDIDKNDLVYQKAELKDDATVTINNSQYQNPLASNLISIPLYGLDTSLMGGPIKINELVSKTDGKVQTEMLKQQPANSLPLSNAATTPVPSSFVKKPIQSKCCLFPKLATPVLVDSSKLWECDVCSKAFTTKYFLKKHKRLHTGEMPYTCEICARAFTFQQSYHKHLLYHNDEKPHMCSTCGRSFKELSTLHNHERIHSGEKPFKCEVCGKSFRQRVSFLVHSRIHTGAMPYKCEVCKRSFRYKVSQRNHKCSRPVSTNANALVNSGPFDSISQSFVHKCTSPLKTTETNISDENPITEDMLIKALDDIVVESCKKLGIDNNAAPLVDYSPLLVNCSNETHSLPPEKDLRNLHLYSPELVQTETMKDIREEQQFTTFLHPESKNNNIFD